MPKRVCSIENRPRFISKANCDLPVVQTVLIKKIIIIIFDKTSQSVLTMKLEKCHVGLARCEPTTSMIPVQNLIISL